MRTPGRFAVNVQAVRLFSAAKPGSKEAKLSYEFQTNFSNTGPTTVPSGKDPVAVSAYLRTKYGQFVSTC